MTEEYVQVPRDGAGKKLRTTVTTVEGEEVHQEVIQIVNSSDTIINPAIEEKQDDIITGLDHVEILKNKGTISTNNSTTIPLGIDGIFTGIADDIKDYAAINIAIWTNQDSATKGLSIEWSQDGTNWDEKMTVGIAASKAESYEFGVRARYFRIVYTNGGIAQGAFRLQVILNSVRTREGARCLCLDIDEREFAKTVRAILAAKMPNGLYTNIHATVGGNLKLSLEEYDSTFNTNPLPVKNKALGTPTTTALTLTTANTAYLIPTSELIDRRTVIIYNKSDTDIYYGSSNVTTTNGILLASGGNISLDIESGLYAVCGTSAKIINVLELK